MHACKLEFNALSKREIFFVDLQKKIIDAIWQVVHWNLFDLTLYKGLWVVVYLLNGHLSKDLAPKMGYQYQAYFCF